MLRGLQALASVLLVAGCLSACGGGGNVLQPAGSSLPGDSQPAASSQAAAAAAGTLAISERDALAAAQKGDGHHTNLPVAPSSLTLTLPTAQALTVTVKSKTVVFAASTDLKIASVSPVYVDVDTLTGGSGTAVFTVTPQAVGKAKIGLIDLQGKYAIVPVTVSAASPTPTPSPTPAPTPIPTPTPPPTPTPTGNGQFTFNPPSPLHLGVNGTSTVSVAEGNYSGNFSLSGCSGGICEVYGTGYDCIATNNSTGGDTDISFVTKSGNPTDVNFKATQNMGGSSPPSNLSCTFNLADQYGHSATYTVDYP